MAAQNRVTPRSEIVATPLRGLFMGNRGCLHEGRSIVRNHNGRRWITCDPDHGGRRVEQWADGRYTVLFFTDEAVALAAGHRPCALCRRPAVNAFSAAWAAAFGSAPAKVDVMDRRLHDDRLDGRRQRTHQADWSSLPEGTFALDGDTPALVLGDRLVPWTPHGYGSPVGRPTTGAATVLTPAATVEVLRHGYRPVIAAPPA